MVSELNEHDPSNYGGPQGENDYRFLVISRLEFVN